MRNRLSFLLVPLSCVLCPLSLSAADWLHWRGPEQTGVSREKDLPDKWSTDEKAADNNLVWKKPYGCRSTPVVHNGRVFIINGVGEGANEQERVLCLNADTGEVIWEYKFNVFHTDIVSSRVGWTNLAGDAETGNIYAHGTQGLLYCFSRDGKVLWSHSLAEEYGRVSGYGGRLASPLIDGDLVIIGMINASWGNQARGAHRFVAFDKKNGEVVWWSELPKQMKGTYYSNPVIAVINGQRLLITGAADGGVHALQPRTGKLVWSYEFCEGVVNGSPVVDGTKIYIGHGEENHDNNLLGRFICIDAGKLDKEGKPTLVWEVPGLKAGYASPCFADGKVFVCDDTAKMYCLDAASGEKLWEYRYGRLSRGSPIFADGKIYVFEVNSNFHILQPGATSCKPLHKQFFPGGGGFIECNGTPAVANGKVYLTTRQEIYCIGKKGAKPQADPMPSLAAEPKADPSAKPAQIQIVPADVVTASSGTVAFKARLFDAQGRFLKEAPATWALPEPPLPPGAKAAPPALKGAIDASGKLVVDKVPGNQQGYVQAKVGELTSAFVRVRVAPVLPFKLDVSKVPDGAAPGGFVNMQGKYAVFTLPDMTKILKKLANDARPPLARANAYLGLPTLSGYTIQGDLLGKAVANNLPDMGLVSHRYTLLFDGKPDPDDKKRRLRLVSWEAQGRVNQSVIFDWKPDVWYRAILVVEQQKDKAVIRGKVWPRDQAEPKDWTITFADATPNREGAPAIYAYATGILPGQDGAEAYFANISVTVPAKAGQERMVLPQVAQGSGDFADLLKSIAEGRPLPGPSLWGERAPEPRAVAAPLTVATGPIFDSVRNEITEVITIERGPVPRLTDSPASCCEGCCDAPVVKKTAKPDGCSACCGGDEKTEENQIAKRSPCSGCLGTVVGVWAVALFLPLMGFRFMQGRNGKQ